MGRYYASKVRATIAKWTYGNSGKYIDSPLHCSDQGTVPGVEVMGWVFRRIPLSLGLERFCFLLRYAPVRFDPPMSIYKTVFLFSSWHA